MIDMSNKCLFCDSEQNLNTKMNIVANDIEFSVAICTSHEDEASPKAVRELIQKKAIEIEELKKTAAKYGLKLEESSIASQPSGHKNFRQDMKKQQIKKVEPEMEEPQNEPDVTSRGTRAIHDQESTVGVEHYDKYLAPEKVKTIAAQNQKITTESGREVVLPSVLHDSMGGKTTIRIVNTGGDKALQNRFKSLADSSKNGSGPDFRNQYGVRDCTACGGSGVSRVNKKQSCPRCGGDGIAK